MPDLTNTHPFVRGVLASLCHDADDPLMPELGLRRDCVPETVLRLHGQPGVRFASRGDRERPLSRDGAVTCHFDQTSISKSSPIRALVRAAKAGRRYHASRASAHEAYIERPGAAEWLGPTPNGRTTRREGREQQAYLERDGAVEADPDDALSLASFGTIGDTPAERTRFWEFVEESERAPHGDRITIDPSRAPDWWARAFSAIDAAPEAARATLRAAGAQRSAPLDLRLPTEDAFALSRWAIGLGADAPVTIAPGRGGRTQTRIIAELPHEIDARARLAIVRAFTDKLAARGFPYWAVVHAPDARNDVRNFHVHIVYYDRPARQMPHPDTGAPTWDFAITCERRRANRTRVLARPYRQPKDRASHDRAWIGELRTHWGACCNAVLAEAGIGKCYDLRAYATIGIDQAPGIHVPARQYNKERKGALTEAGADLARRQWQAEADCILDARASATGTKLGLFLQQGRQAEFAAPRTAIAERGATGRDRARDPVELVRALIRRGLALVVEIGRLELARDLAQLVCARTLSRPRLLLAASAAPRRARGAKADPGGTTAQDPPVPEGTPFGLARRSDLVVLCDRLGRGGGRLAAAYETRIADARERLDRIRADLAMAGRTSMDPARAGEAVVAGADPASPAVPVDPVSGAQFAARVRASLEPATAEIWDRYAAAGLETAEAAAGTPSPAIASPEPKPSMRPERRSPEVRPPVEAAGSTGSSFMDAAVRAAASFSAKRGSPTPLPRRPQPRFDPIQAFGFGQNRRSNGAPVIRPGDATATGGETAAPSDAGAGPPGAPHPPAALPVLAVPASAAEHAPTPSFPEAVAQATLASTPVAAPLAPAPMPTATALAPAAQVSARLDPEVAQIPPAPAVVASKRDEAPEPVEPAPAPAPAEIGADPAATVRESERIQPVRSAAPAIGSEPQQQVPALQPERTAQIRTERSSNADALVAGQAPTAPLRRDGEDDAPWPQLPQAEEPDPEARTAPPPPLAEAAQPRRVPLSADHEADAPVAAGKSRAGARRRAPPPSTERGRRRGSGIGD